LGRNWSRIGPNSLKHICGGTPEMFCLRKTGFSRLDRKKFSLDDPVIRKKISKGLYSDYHCYRPMSEYSNINYAIYNLLQ